MTREPEPYFFIVRHRTMEPPPKAFGYPAIRPLEGPYSQEEAIEKARACSERCTVVLLESPFTVWPDKIVPKTAVRVSGTTLLP